MRLCYCKSQHVYFYVRLVNEVEDRRIELFSYDDGCSLEEVTLSFLLSYADIDCVYINNVRYPWLSKFLIDNGVAFPTHRITMHNGKAYSEFKL